MRDKLMSNTQNNNYSGSTTSDITDWADISWSKIEKYVDKLQKRIYRAENEKDSYKVRNLQRLLIYSDSTLLLAIKRVTQTNKGKRTAGIDKFRALTGEQRINLFHKMKTMNIRLHKPKPALRKYIPKKNGKYRSLGIPVIIDRIYQEILRMALEPQAEVNFEPTSYGFRPKRGVHDAVARIFHNIVRGKWCWVFEGDFKSCFDTLNHEFILSQIRGFPCSNLINRFLKAGYVDDNIFHRTSKGTPQGGLLSPLLANIALNGMEQYLGISYKEILRSKEGNPYIVFMTIGNYRMVRYADDFVIFAQNRKDIEEVYDILKPYLEERGLTLAEDKTRITHISEGFDFLGFNFRQYDTKGGNKCFIKPSKKSIKSFKAKVRDRFRLFNGHNVDELIDNLNPLIIGTANFWRHVVSKKTFSNMDYYLWNKVYKFLRRLHPKKGWNWIKEKYFPRFDNGKHKDKWVLTGSKTGRYLYKMSWTPIFRHSMIKNNYSPYDATKKEYFIKREERGY